MKRIFTLLAIFATGAAAALAEAPDAFVFTNADGEAFDNGYELTVSDAIVEEDPETGEKSIMLPSGLYIKRGTADASQEMRIAIELQSIDNGDFQLCFPVNCHLWSEAGNYVTESTRLSGDTPSDAQCEWFAIEDGSCRVKLTVELGHTAMGSWTTDDTGASITLNFQYSESGVAGIKTDAASESARYNVAGQRLSEPQPGINIVRFSDGTARKELVK